MSLPRSVHDEMVAHALEDRPYEVCGLLAGEAGRVTRVFRARNKERSPVRYEIEPTDLLRIFREIDDADLEHVGMYHSHTHTQAYPSATDIRLAYYPDALYFIVSLLDERAPHVRAFRIRDGEITEEPIEIEEPVEAALLDQVVEQALRLSPIDKIRLVERVASALERDLTAP